jgi:hypothetical protein
MNTILGNKARHGPGSMSWSTCAPWRLGQLSSPGVNGGRNSLGPAVRYIRLESHGLKGKTSFFWSATVRERRGHSRELNIMHFQTLFVALGLGSLPVSYAASGKTFTSWDWLVPVDSLV